MPWKRPKAPETLRQAVDLRTEERVLSAAEAAGDTFVVATNFALSQMLPTGEGQGSGEGQEYAMAWRIPWDHIDKAQWEPPHLVLQLRPGDPASPGEQVAVEIDIATDFPAVVRDQVQTSILASEEIDVLGTASRVVARRSPESGDTVWRVMLGKGLDPSDEATREAAKAGLAAYRERIGV